MRPENSPFPAGWWATGLEVVGLGEQRPQVSTYACYDYAALPPLPYPMNGDLAWLARAPRHEHNVGDPQWKENEPALIALQGTCDTISLQLPVAFSTFVSSLPLQQRIRSNTDCEMWVSHTVARSPIADGYLIRFLADSQGCIFWYVYAAPDGSDHAVVASPNLYGSDSDGWSNEPLGPATIVFTAGSFEEFLCRFWLENELWFTAGEKRPISDAAKSYIAHYQRMKKHHSQA
jgi:hypothetical protein